MDHSQQMLLVFSQAKPRPTARSVRSPKETPPNYTSASLIIYSVLDFGILTVKQEETLEQAELRPMSTCMSKFPCVSKSAVFMKTVEMGGWWKVCSRQMGIPPSRPWKVSPRMGLKGFSTLGKQELTKRQLMATYLICSTGSLALTASWMNLGKKPIMLQRTSSIDFRSKISTGSDMFMIDLPDIRLEPICFRIIFSTPFCAFSTSQLQKIRLLLASFHLPPCSRKSLCCLQVYLEALYSSFWISYEKRCLRQYRSKCLYLITLRMSSLKLPEWQLSMAATTFRLFSLTGSGLSSSSLLIDAQLWQLFFLSLCLCLWILHAQYWRSKVLLALLGLACLQQVDRNAKSCKYWRLISRLQLKQSQPRKSILLQRTMNTVCGESSRKENYTTCSMFIFTVPMAALVLFSTLFMSRQCLPYSCAGFCWSFGARHAQVLMQVMVRCVFLGYESRLCFLNLRKARKVLLLILLTILKLSTQLFHCGNSMNLSIMPSTSIFSSSKHSLKLPSVLSSSILPFSMFLTSQNLALSASSQLMAFCCTCARYSFSSLSILSSSSQQNSNTPLSLSFSFSNSSSEAISLAFNSELRTPFSLSRKVLRSLIRLMMMPWMRAHVPSYSKPTWYLCFPQAMPKMCRFLSRRYTLEMNSLSSWNSFHTSLLSVFLKAVMLWELQVRKQEFQPAKVCSLRKVAFWLLKYSMISLPARHLTRLMNSSICPSLSICCSDISSNSGSRAMSCCSLPSSRITDSKYCSLAIILPATVPSLLSNLRSWSATSSSELYSILI